ncbi:MAG: 4Fe-4S binding protein [Candidatus Eisenbacteria bacterium]|nr:4Fe-4S binding protein [Candidatus Eisenbacteria bacterium]
MKISIAGGKGGTGKTTVAIGLASAVREDVLLLDCDVEEPKCHHFLNPKEMDARSLSVLTPNVIAQKCTGCGACRDICEYNAIIMMGSKPLVFPELCHGCGECIHSCPTDAIVESLHEIGVIERGRSGRVTLVQGKLNIGEVISSPLIRAVRAHEKGNELTIIDSPPGATCPTVAAVKDTDFVVLVAEPTPRGYGDLVVAVEMIEALKLRYGIVINRVGTGDDRVHRYCKTKEIPILAEIPSDGRIAEAYSLGRAIVDALPEYRNLFIDLLEEVQGSVMS